MLVSQVVNAMAANQKRTRHNGLPATVAARTYSSVWSLCDGGGPLFHNCLSSRTSLNFSSASCSRSFRWPRWPRGYAYGVFVAVDDDDLTLDRVARPVLPDVADAVGASSAVMLGLRNE